MCYCDLPVSQIRADFERGTVPDEALTRGCCWAQVCRVRGWHPDAISDDDWRELCSRRGYLFSSGF
jgi:hypothetical protein